ARLAAVALASSLDLHLHQVGQRTFTSKLPSMPGTQRSRWRGGRYRVCRHKQLPSAWWTAVPCSLMIEDSLFRQVKISPMVNSFNQTSLESFFGTFSIA